VAHRIIALLSAKGGCGKSTLAVSIAAEMVKRGRAVTIIDADPAGGTSAWHNAGGSVQQIPLIQEPTENVRPVALDASKHGVAIIDCAGFATRSTVAAIEASDLVLIPCRPSGLDAVRAIESAEMVKAVARDYRRRIPAKVVLNSVTRSTIVPHIRAELERAGVKVTATEIHQRTAFAVASLNGDAPCWMGSSAAKAAGDIAALVDELGI
jgi:chromosome partitioning protein